ncbi:MAG: MMPL family transporter [Chloroflexi bacterium]|nr:MMPL family transporter [Chloroflexota bacterium]
MTLHDLGLLMVRRRWWVVALWAAVLVPSLVLAPRVTSALKSGFGEAQTESRVALRLMSDRLDIPESSVTLVFSSDELQVTDPRYAQAVEGAVAPLRDIPEVRRVVTYYNTNNPDMISADGRTTYGFVLLDAQIDAAIDMFPEIRKRLRPGELQVWTTGGIAIFSDLNEASERDLRRAEIIALPLVLIALVVVFGSVVAAGLPLVMGLVSITTTLALVYLLAQTTDMSIFVLNIASFLGLGMAVDYTLLMVSRFREELASRTVEEAVAVTCSTAGKAILFSAATSVIGLSGLLLFDFMMLRSLGIGGMAVILLSMLLALSLVPALLGTLGARVNSLSVIPRPVGEGRFWLRLSAWVMRHPLLVIVPVVTGLLLLGLPFLDVKPGTPWASILPGDAEARRGWQVAAEEFGPGELAPIVLIATSETSVLSPENVGAAYDFARRLEEDPRVVRVDSIVSLDSSLSRQGYQRLYTSHSPGQLGGPEVATALDELVSDSRDTSMMRIVSTSHPVSDETKALVDEIRRDMPAGDLETFLTGVTPDVTDTVDRMYSDFPKVIIFVTIATYLCLLWLFRSVVLPLKAVLMNMMSILASFGALVFVFQQGRFEGLLGFTSEGFTEASVPILLFAIVFGLSMDYEVFLLSRIKEEYDATGDNTHSVATGMERSGGIITSAALVLILVASAFAASEVLIVKMLGFGIALAIFIDSTIVRALLVPALMRIMSDLNWWAPTFLREKTTGR